MLRKLTKPKINKKMSLTYYPETSGSIFTSLLIVLLTGFFPDCSQHDGLRPKKKIVIDNQQGKEVGNEAYFLMPA